MAYWTHNDNLEFVPLTPEQEKDLFKQYYKGDLAARDTIIQHHLKHITKLALRFAKQAFPDDLAISAGVEGLMQALTVKQFKPRKGIRFSSYLIPFVRGKVFRAMKNHHVIPVPVLPDYSFHGEDAALTGQLCDDSIALNHGIRTGYIPVEQIPAPEDTVDHEAESNDLAAYRRKVIEEALKRLRPQDAVVVRKVALEGMTLAEVAGEDGHARQNVGPRYLRGVARLKVLLAPLKGELGL